MTTSDLENALVPISDLLQEQIEEIQYLSKVQFGVIVGLGVIAGLIMIYLLLRRF